MRHRLMLDRMSDASEAAGTFTCPYCQASFEEEQALRDHFCPLAFQH